jgi:lipid II:glycine glycyltransferase (peptidoglycan interpeptide bridge formation enzyme)
LAPKEFFDFFRKHLVPNGLGKFLLIRHEGKIIGGIVCPIFPGKAIYEWYIAGMDKEYKDQYPSILSTWAAIAEGQKMELKHFDFLGAGKPDADYGVRDFKAKFGGELIQYGRYEKIHQPFLMKIGILGLKLLKFIK